MHALRQYRMAEGMGGGGGENGKMRRHSLQAAASGGWPWLWQASTRACALGPAAPPRRGAALPGHRCTHHNPCCLPFQGLLLASCITPATIQHTSVRRSFRSFCSRCQAAAHAPLKGASALAALEGLRAAVESWHSEKRVEEEPCCCCAPALAASSRRTRHPPHLQ